MLTATQKTAIAGRTPFDKLDKWLNQKRGVIRGRYSFAVDGGAVGSILLKDENGDLVKLPSGAIITQCYLDVITAFVSTSNDGTIAFTANSSGDLLAAVDADTKSGITAGIPVGTAATMVKLTADRQILMEIATHAMTAGKADFYIEFVIGGV